MNNLSARLEELAAAVEGLLGAAHPDIQQRIQAEAGHLRELAVWEPPSLVKLDRLAIADMSKLLAFEAYYRVNGSYDRFPRPFFLRPAMQLSIVAIDGVSVARRALPLGEYKLTLDAKVVASATVSANATRLSFWVNLSEFDVDKSHLLSIVGPDSSWTSLPMWANFAGGRSPTVPITRANYDFLHDRRPYQYGLVPAGAQPTPRPLKSAQTAPVAKLTQSALSYDHLVPWERHDTYRQIMTSDGWTTVNSQSYNMSQLVAKMPPLPEFDGQRGVGTFRMATDITPSHTGGAWACNPWRCVNIGGDGRVKTLLGWRHNQETGKLELVGDWDLVPAALEFWRFVFDERTLPRGGAPIQVGINPDGSPIMMTPHLVNPVAYAFASQANTIYRAEFDRLDPTLTTPPRVTRFLTGLGDPFGGDCRDGKLYVCERMAHRISVWDVDTRTLIDVLASGRALTTVTPGTRLVAPIPGQVLGSAEIRAEPCVGPEGGLLVGDWFRFGSRSMAQIRQVNIHTKEVQVLVENCRVDGNSHFINIAAGASDFGGEDLTLYDSWTSDNQGRPIGLQGNFGSSYAGPGRPWETLGYGCAVGLGKQMVFCSSSSNGLTRHYAKRADEISIPVQTWRSWKAAWAEAGYDMLYGDEACAGFGLPLPWGASDEFDSYMEACGLTKE